MTTLYLVERDVMSHHTPQAVDQSRQSHCPGGVAVPLDLRGSPCKVKQSASLSKYRNHVTTSLVLETDISHVFLYLDVQWDNTAIVHVVLSTQITHTFCALPTWSCTCEWEEYVHACEQIVPKICNLHAHTYTLYNSWITSNCIETHSRIGCYLLKHVSDSNFCIILK